MSTGRTLVVTNDFPPRAGGIQAMVMQMLTHLDSAKVVVHTSAQGASADYDATLPFPVIRDPSRVLLPTPAIRGRVIDTMTRFGCDRVWFPAAAPLGLLASALREHGARRTVASTMGHEIWWAAVPGTAQAMRRIGATNDVITYLTAYTRERIAPVLRARDATAMIRLAPGVDSTSFVPGAGRATIRSRYHLGERPVIVCVSRLVARKGQDLLIQALPHIQREVPGAALLLVGEGPDAHRLRMLASRLGVRSDVFFTGRALWGELAAHHAAGDVFAMPCRTRHSGFDVEGLGICYLEAAAVGLPVITGDSGGAPDAVLEGRSGFVVGGRDLRGLVERINWLLNRPDDAARMGKAGREWVRAQWQPADQARVLAGLLEPPRTPG